MVGFVLCKIKIGVGGKFTGISVSPAVAVMNNMDSISLAISPLSRLPDLSLSYLWEQEDHHQTVTDRETQTSKSENWSDSDLGSDLMRNISLTLEMPS